MSLPQASKHIKENNLHEKGIAQTSEKQNAKNNTKAILSSLYSCGVVSLSFLSSMLVAALVALILLFFLQYHYVRHIKLDIFIVFLSLLAGNVSLFFILFGGLLMIYCKYINIASYI